MSDSDSEDATQRTVMPDQAVPDQAALLEDGQPQPPAGTRFSKADRERFLQENKHLPPAWRVPTELSLTYFVKSVVDVPVLLAALTNYRDEHPAVMKAIIKTIVAQISPRIPKRYRGTLKSMVSATLSNGVHGYYSLEATARRLGAIDFAECCARDHYLRGSYFKRFHPFIIYRFILFMQTKDERLHEASESTSVCAVCQDRAARRSQEGGDRVMWRQAEPCRHWTCDPCTRDLVARGIADRCSTCRAMVLTYALGVAPGGNQ